MKLISPKLKYNCALTVDKIADISVNKVVQKIVMVLNNITTQKLTS